MTKDEARQLAFALPHSERFGREDFLVTSANEVAEAWVTRWPDWPNHCFLLTGPPGSGKSHLASIWAMHADAPRIAASDLDGNQSGLLSGHQAYAIDDIDRNVSEQAIFHLLNIAREEGLWLFLTASRGPDLAWPRLPDLASRLRALPTASLGPPDETLLRALLVKLFDERQLQVDADVIDYLMRRMERSHATARHIVAALDIEGLARGRRITRALAATILTRMEEGIG